MRLTVGLTGRAGLIGLALALAVLGCRGSEAAAGTGVADDALPRLTAPADDVAALVGTSFVGSDLPAPLAPPPESQIWGGLVLDDARRYGMNWVQIDEHVDVVISEIEGHTEDGKARFRVVSGHRIALPPDALFTVGALVCQAPSNSYAGAEGEFVAVTNEAQDLALAAWVVTVDGFEPYDVDGLVCERFVP